jgi:putative inorganic carbon (hco3(-)) transporter
MGLITRISGTVVYQTTKLYLFRLLALLLPFSSEVPIADNTMLSVPTEPLIVLLALFFLIDLVSDAQPYLRLFRREGLWIIPLATAFVISTFFSGMPLVSLKFSFINALFIFVFFVGFTQLLSEQPTFLRELLLIFTAGLTLVLCWGLYWYWHYGWNPVVVRGIFHPFFKDHTIFGASAALLSAFWIGQALLVRDLKQRFRVYFFLIGLICIVCVVVSSSRAAFLSLLASVVVYVLLWMRVRFIYIAAAVILAAATLWMLRFPVIEQMQRAEMTSDVPSLVWVERKGTVVNIRTDVSSIERMNRWISAWRMFRERPLTGYGPGTFQFKYIPYQEPALMNRLTVTDPFNVPEGSGGTAHSEYFLALSEMGIMGIIGWILLVGRFVWIAFSNRKYKTGIPAIHIAFIAISTYLFHALFNNFLTTDKFAFLFWGTAAWLIANKYIADDIPNNRIH